MPLFYLQGYIEHFFRDKFEELQNKLDFTLREKTSQIGQAIKHSSYGGLRITKRKRTANLFTHS